MAKNAIKNGLVRLGGYDLTGDVNAIALSYGAVALDATSLGNLSRNFMGGLKTTKCVVKGFWNATNGGAEFADMGLTDILTVGFTKTEGGIVYFQKGMIAQYTTGDQVGKVLPFSLTAEAAGDLIRGTLVANKSAIAATGFGTGFQLGAVLAAQSVYAALHVTAATGAGEDDVVIVQSSVDNTFASPTTRLTFAGALAIGAQLISAAGPITDTWWRVGYTISGSTPSFDFTTSIGIQ
jgi:hypothetical protein